MKPMANRAASTNVMGFVRRNERDMAMVECPMRHLVAVSGRERELVSTASFVAIKESKIVEGKGGRQSASRRTHHTTILDRGTEMMTDQKGKAFVLGGNVEEKI